MDYALIIISLFIILELLNYGYFYLFYQIGLLRKTLFLGVFIHEFSHFLMCKLTGAPVFDFKVGLKAGFVKHGESRIPLIGGALISLAPLLVGLMILICLMINLSSLTWADIVLMGKSTVKIDSAGLIAQLRLLLTSFNYGSWWFWLAVLLSLSILATFKPSHQDLYNIVYFIAIFLALSYFFEFMVPVNMVIIFVLVLANILQLSASLAVLPIFLIKKFFYAKS